MIEIVSGTDRPKSRSIEIANYIQRLFEKDHAEAEVLDLAQLNLADVAGGHYGKGARGTYQAALAKVNAAEGLIFVVPEYNGSYPGVLKLFIDYWKYPESFDNRPIAFVGLGARWGGLRPVEHLQQVFGYRNAYIFPHRVFVHNVNDAFQNGEFTDPTLANMIRVQTSQFVKYVRALQAAGLDANSKRKS